MILKKSIFWLIYIFEIEAVSHLASIPIFLVIISDLLKFEKFENFDVKYIFYFSILNCGLFLIYPELFCICSIICGIYLFEKFLKSNKKMNFLKSITLILLIFFLITLPSYKTNYMFLMNQLNLSLDSSKDWWGVISAIISVVLLVGFYFFLMATFRAIGKKGVIDPFFSAWIPNLCYFFPCIAIIIHNGLKR